MGFLDYDPYYRCAVCGRRLHELKMSGSLTGDVECCGQKMSRPGDPVLTLAVAASLGAGALAWFLASRGLLQSAAVSILVFAVVMNLLRYLRDRVRK